MYDELSAYAQVLEDQGVEVVRRNLPDRLSDGRVPYNGVFTRDQLTLTPEGAICARMASEVRAGEELIIQDSLARTRVPSLFRVHRDAVHEGADLLWLGPSRALLGLGARTDAAAALQIRRVLAMQGVSLDVVGVPRCVQHLLGVLQIVGPSTAVVRGQLLAARAFALLRNLGFTVVDLAETDEVAHGQAMNFTVLRPGEVVMAAGCPNTERTLRHAGIAVVRAIDIPNLIKAGGGLACATGILERR